MAQKPPPRRPQAPTAPPARIPRPPRDPHKTKLIDKDPWGYNFAQPIWKLDPGAERMKRAPEDRERERIGAVLTREYELDPKQLGGGFDGEAVPWGLFREEKKKSPRRLLAEATREACLKSRGGVLGIFQTHFLAHKLGLMHTVRAKADSVAFPLAITFENTVMLDKYEGEYVLHLDRVFYPIFPSPKPTRFAEPLVLADAYRWLDHKGESVVRSPKKEPLIMITGDPHADPRSTFEWRLAVGDHVLTLEEPLVRTPGFTLKNERGDVLVSVESALKPDARSFDLTMRIDFVTDIKAWLGFLSVYMDAFTQRAQGILGRAREAAEAKDKAELEAAEREE